MDFKKLATLLATDDYAGLTDAEAATLANDKRHTIQQDKWFTYRSLAGRDGVGIDSTRRLIQSVEAVSASDEFVAEMRYSLRGDTGVNANDTSTLGMLDLFAANTNLPLTQADATAMKALADEVVSDADQNGLGVVREGDVQVARAS